MLPALDGLAAADRRVSWGPVAFDGLDADEAQRFLWRVVESSPSVPKLTVDGREVGEILEVCQWPFPVDGLPDRTMFACVRWTEPAAAASPGLTWAGQPVRVIRG